jgi:hypothetical protein
MSNTISGWTEKRIGDLIDGSFAGEWGDPEANDANDIPVLRSTKEPLNKAESKNESS